MRKPITRKEFNDLWSFVKGVAEQASNHDPEHEARIGVIEHQLEVLNERLTEKLGNFSRKVNYVPQYRTVRNGRLRRLRSR